MNNFKQYFINKVFIFTVVIFVLIASGFGYAQLVAGTGDKPEDWGENQTSVINQLMNLMNYDESGTPYPQGANPNSGIINSLQSTYNAIYGYSSGPLNAANVNVQNSNVYNVMPNANNEVVIPATNINQNPAIANNGGNYPCTVLRTFMSRGNSGSSVYSLQTFLYHFDYMTVIPNGNFGPATEAAVRAFQAENGIDVRGYVGPSTRSAIASITCNGDPYSVNLAKTVLSVAPSYTPLRQSTNISVSTPASQNINVQVAANSYSTGSQPANQSVNINTQADNKLSANNLSFGQSAKLYWTYKLSPNEKIYICLENIKNKTCESGEYIEVRDMLTGTIYDSIKITDSWAFTLYNSSDWNQGGAIKIRSGNNVYTVNISV